MAKDFKQAICKMCDETDGAITHKWARPALEKLGFKIADKDDKSALKTESWKFNSIKSHWKRKQKQSIVAPSVVQTNDELKALAFIEDSGGIAKVEKMLSEARQTVDHLESVLKTVDDLKKRVET